MRNNDKIEKLPGSYRKDIETAINVLTGEGCKEIYLFGSLVNGDSTDKSDIDIAVTGLPKGGFFETFGKLMMALEHPVDLISLDKENRFVSMLKRRGGLLRVS